MQAQQSDTYFKVLGPLEIQRGGGPVALGPRQRRILLLRLLAENGRIVSTDRLRDDVWGGHPSRGSISSLHAHISRLRAALEPDRACRGHSRLLVTETSGYALRVPHESLDTVQFQRDLDRAQRQLSTGEPAAACREAERALVRWRGTPFVEAADYPFAAQEIFRLEEGRLRAREVRISALLALSQFDAATAAAQELTADHPMNEVAWVLMMRALYLSGRSAEAIRQYDVVRDRLNAELGLEPGPGLRGIQLAILRHDTRQIAPEPPQRTELAFPKAAPLRDAPLLPGRSAELSRLDELLGAAGSGETAWAMVSGELGWGKTRLAEELARRAADRGFAVVWTRHGGEAGGPASATPFWTALQMLQQLLPERDTLTQAALSTGEVSAPMQRLTFFEDVAKDLQHALADRPTLCLIDDMQWIDPESCELLAFLAVYLRELPLAVVCNTRDASQAGVNRVSALLARQGGVHLRLSPLTAQEAKEVVCQWQATSSAPVAACDLDRTARELHRRSAGNPFFLTELLRSMADRTGCTTPRVPASAHSVLTALLGGLQLPVRALLETAAVVAEAVDIDLLARLRGSTSDEVLDLVGAAAAAGAVRWEEGSGPWQPGRCRFTWPVLREVVLAELPPVRRKRLQTAVAECVHLHASLVPAAAVRLPVQPFRSDVAPRMPVRALSSGEGG
ncbi:BTAD domain-containing putative transcriptional regulator [Streptomyces sp. NPDC057575]|uniref:BTAD domain-containing putative transcriptional regulator n=1 Tax=unclassified Streptomyces TaxID=2593676 RepID=UPI0036AE2C6E